jgi:hypothetical protein
MRVLRVNLAPSIYPQCDADHIDGNSANSSRFKRARCLAGFGSILLQITDGNRRTATIDGCIPVQNESKINSRLKLLPGDRRADPRLFGPCRKGDRRMEALSFTSPGFNQFAANPEVFAGLLPVLDTSCNSSF